MDPSGRVVDESTETAPPGGDAKHSALFTVVVVVFAVALSLPTLFVAYLEVWVVGLWFGSGERWSGFPWVLVVAPIVGLLVLYGLSALWMSWAAQRPWARTVRRLPGIEAHHRTSLPDAIDRTGITEEHYQASLDQHLANLLQRRRRRAITETEYQTELLEVRRLMKQRAEGTTEGMEHETAGSRPLS